MGKDVSCHAERDWVSRVRTELNGLPPEEVGDVILYMLVALKVRAKSAGLTNIRNHLEYVLIDLLAGTKH
jgi:hypothetical protein